MDYLNLHAPDQLTAQHTHPDDISSLVGEIAGPAAAWAKVEYNEAANGRDLKLVAGEGLGRVVGLRLAEIGGKTVKKWFVADRYEDRPRDWLTGEIPETLQAPFKNLKELLRRPKPLPAGKPMLFHRSPATLNI